MTFNNLLEFTEVFSSEEACHRYLKSILWKDGKHCPHCGSNKIIEFASNFKKNRCQDCKLDFSIRKGTIFEESRISLRKWFMAIYLTNSNNKGISSYGLAKQLGITQKTAWFILHRLRHIAINFLPKQFNNITEVDEAYIGGSERFKHSNKKHKISKSVVFGMYNRETGTVKANVVQSNKSYELQEQIMNHIEEGSIICSDSYEGYDCLKWNYKHYFVKHSVGEYVRGDITEDGVILNVHTNSLEGFWGILKRGLKAIYYQVSKKHLQKYLNEFCFRYNTRKEKEMEKFIAFLGNVQGRLKYRELIARV